MRRGLTFIIFGILALFTITVQSTYLFTFLKTDRLRNLLQGNSKDNIWCPLFNKSSSERRLVLMIQNIRPYVLSKCPGKIPCIAIATTFYYYPLKKTAKKWIKHLKKWRKLRKTCPVECDLVSDLFQGDAVLFHGRDLPEKLPGRELKQKWVYLNFESPLATNVIGYNLLQNNELYRLIFNWTSSYLSDSEIYLPYGFIKKRQHPYSDKAIFVNMTQKETLAMIAVSNCRPFNDRKEKVRSLKKLMEISTFGFCYDSPINSQADLISLTRKHYFYLSFENSFCQDYITEKFFTNGLRGHAVPVVFGGLSKEDYLRVSPPHSFIYARDFRTMEDLADYLKYLVTNVTAYLEYYDWKKSYEVVDDVIEDRIFCSVCRKLWLENGVSTSTTTDLKRYYNVEKNCLPRNFTSYLL